ncbi:MAG: hypothetical protein ACW99A_17350 [Candidatus Kariarchaeaceae archaeon]
MKKLLNNGWFLILLLFSMSLLLNVKSEMGSLELNATEIVIDWTNLYGGEGDGSFDIDLVDAMIQTSDGGVAIAGRTSSWGMGELDFWLLKIDTHGDVQWNKTFGGPSYDIAYSLIQTSDGGYALVGIQDAWSEGVDQSILLVITDSSGNEEYNNTFPVEGGPTDIIQTSDGEYVLLVNQEASEGESDVLLIKTNVNGQHEWNVSYGGPGYQESVSLIQTDDGYIFAGSTNSQGAGMSDFWLVKTDTNGKFEWDKTFGGPGYDKIESFIQTSDGDLVMTGFNGATTEYGSLGDPWWVNTNSNGIHQWDRVMQSGGPTIQTNDGGFAFGGADEIANRFWISKTHASGEIEWEKYVPFVPSMNDKVVGKSIIVQANDGGLVIAASEGTSGDPGNWDVRVIKTEVVSQPPNKNITDDESDDGFLNINIFLIFGSVLVLGILNNGVKRKRKT